MPYGLTNSALALPGSRIRRMFNLASELDNVVDFSLGEPDFTTPQNIIEAGYAAVRAGNTHYTANAGLPQLRQAIARRYKKLYPEYDVDWEKNVIVTSGGMGSLALIFRVLLDPGDEVIISNPYWSNYRNMIEIQRAVPVFAEVREENDYMYDPDEIESLITDRTKVIVVNSPSNPTGGVMSREVLTRIGQIAVEHDIMVISDEVYRYFVYDDAEFFSLAQVEGMKDHLLIVDSFSKSYAMTGWRIGFTIGPEQIIEVMTKHQENDTACNNNFAQYGAVEALDGPQDALREMIATYQHRRELVLNELKKIDGISCRPPKGAFYAYLNVSGLDPDAQHFAEDLLMKNHVCLVPDTAFRDKSRGFLRMSYANSDENIIEGIRRLGDYVRNL